jgi:hypothetical protein
VDSGADCNLITLNIVNKLYLLYTTKKLLLYILSVLHLKYKKIIKYKINYLYLVITEYTKDIKYNIISLNTYNIILKHL